MHQTNMERMKTENILLLADTIEPLGEADARKWDDWAHPYEHGDDVPGHHEPVFTMQA